MSTPEAKRLARDAAVFALGVVVLVCLAFIVSIKAAG